MDFIWAILFYLWFELLSLPLRAALARWPAPPDVRRTLSRLAGPVLLVLPVWLAGHGAGWTLGNWSGRLWVAAALALGWLLAGRGMPWPRRLGIEAPRRGWGIDLAGLALFLGFVALRRWIPEMTTFTIDSSGAEKFPNAMIFWSNWHARALPPEDYFLAGERLVYYYWGHFHWAWIGRVGGFPAELAINLAQARLALLVWEGACLLGRAAGLRLAGAAVAALAVAWAGNPKAVAVALDLWKSPWPFNWGAYPYWDASRAIANVVDEFPAFTTLLGDFHAHHLALPWVTGWLALTLAGRRWLGRRGAPDYEHEHEHEHEHGQDYEHEHELGYGQGYRRGFAHTGGAGGLIVWGVVWIALALATTLTNLWNLPLLYFGAGLMGLFTLIHARAPGRRVLEAGGPAAGRWPRRARIAGGLAVLFAALSVALFTTMRLLRSGAPLPLPREAAAGFWQRLPIRILPAELRSSAADLFAFWGLPLLALALAAAARALRRPQPAILVLTCAGWLAVLFASPLVTWRPPGDTAWIWAGAALWFCALAAAPRPWLSPRVRWLGVGVCAVLGGLELVYLPDRFTGELARYNSYFKFSFPVWPPLIIATWLAAWRVWRYPRPWGPGGGARLRQRAAGWAGRAALLAILAASAVYAVLAIPARVIQARRGDLTPRAPTLDAFAFVAHRLPYGVEAPLLAWIRRHVPPGDVVVEAPLTEPGAPWTKAYDYGGRVASLAGHPVPTAWAHHEHQWRGEPAYALTARRTEEVDAFYRAPTPAAMRQWMDRLGYRWALFGVVERARYGEEPLGRLNAAAATAARFPPGRPAVFLFDFAAPQTPTGFSPPWKIDPEAP